MIGEPVPVITKRFAIAIFKTGLGRGPYLLTIHTENVMAWSQIGNHLTRVAVVIPAASTGLLGATAAVASQGPGGGGPDTAGGFTRLAMAILVYGTCAIVVPAGLIGTARQRSHGVTPPAERISRPPLTFR